MMSVLATVAHVIMNILKPIKFPTTDVLGDFGVNDSSISDNTTKDNKRSDPILTRSTQEGGRIKITTPTNNIKTSGQMNKLT